MEGKIVNSLFFSTDSYIGMDQQQDMKLDVKEAAAVPSEHPQWDLSDSDTDNNDQVSPANCVKHLNHIFTSLFPIRKEERRQ